MFLNDHILNIPAFSQMRVIDSTENLLFEHDNGIKEGCKLSHKDRNIKYSILQENIFHKILMKVNKLIVKFVTI